MVPEYNEFTIRMLLVNHHTSGLEKVDKMVGGYYRFSPNSSVRRNLEIHNSNQKVKVHGSNQATATTTTTTN